ncbi:hypothetical protein ES708_13151 [subsurface metagenome]
MRCTWCSKKIKGKKPVVSGEEGPLVYFGPETKGGDVELGPGRKVNFCSNDCAWAYGLETHAFLISPVEIRKHLVEAHGLTPPD